MPIKTLRPRQIKLKNDIREAFRKGFKRIIAVAGCGFGKTPTLVDITNDSVKKGNKVLFIAHRSELISQCSDELSELGLNHGVLITNHSKYNLDLPVQVTSWQTLKNKKSDIFVPNLIMYDEAHRSAAKLPMSVLSRFICPLIGWTATPYRPDGKGLGQLYDCIVESCQVSDLINEGLLMNPDYYVCSNIAASKVLNADSTESEIEEVEAEIIIKADIVRNFKTICGNEQCCVFCPTVERAEEVAKKFENAGFKTGVVDAKTPKKKRERLLREFREKKFQIILNASLLSEGWNYPELGCVILLRNLNSRIFYKQSVGRVMRNAPGKTKAYVLDFFNCIDRFGLPDEDEKYSLTGNVEVIKKQRTEEQLQNLFTVCVNCVSIYSKFQLKCPECGEVNERSEKTIVEEIKNLEKIDKTTFKKVDKQSEFDELCKKAIMKKYAPGWVNNKYKLKFGVWPKALQRTDEWLEYCEAHRDNKQQERENIMDLFGNMEYGKQDSLRTVKH